MTTLPEIEDKIKHINRGKMDYKKSAIYLSEFVRWARNEISYRDYCRIIKIITNKI